MKRVSYTAEFKAEAVKQVLDRGHGLVEVSSRILSLGVTFPLNILLGIPLYTFLARYFLE